MLGLCLSSGATVGALAWWYAAGRRDPVRARLARYAAPDPSVAARHRSVGLYLEQAGVSSTALAAGPVLGLAAGALAGMPLAGGLVGLGAMALRLRLGRQRRLARLQEQLPPALMLIVGALRSGLGFQQAARFVAREGPAPLAEEFERLARELAMGATMADALDRFQARMGCIDAELFASAVAIQLQTGGNMAEILTNLHDTLRDRQAVAAQIQTLTAYGKLSGVVLGVLPVVVGGALSVLNRDYASVLVTDPRGQVMLAACAVGMALATISIRRIVAVVY